MEYLATWFSDWLWIEFGIDVEFGHVSPAGSTVVILD